MDFENEGSKTRKLRTKNVFRSGKSIKTFRSSMI